MRTTSIGSAADEKNILIHRDDSSKDSESNLWESLNGPYSDDVLSVLVPTNNYILAGTPHSIVLSCDHGITWSQCYGSCAPVETIKRAADSNVLAIIGNGFQYAIFSIDNGKTWKPIMMNGDSIWSRIYISEFGRVIIQEKNGEMHQTNNYGKSWSFVKIPKGVGEVNRIWFEQTEEAITITRKGRILYSRDDGHSWKIIGNGFPYGYSALRILDNGEYFLTMGGDGLTFRSKDHGSTWMETKNDELDNYRDIPLNLLGGHLYATSEKNGLIESFNYGKSWSSLGLQGIYVTSVTLDSDSSLIVGTYSHGLYRRSKSNNTWSRLSTGWTPAIVQSVIFDPTGRIYVAAQSFGVYRLDDSGSTWINLQDNMKGKNAESVVIAPNGTVYALGTTQSVLFSTDRGNNWEYLNDAELQKYHITEMAIDSMGNLNIVGPSDGVMRLSQSEKKIFPTSMDYGKEIEKLLFDVSTNTFYGLFGEYVQNDESLHSTPDHLITLYRSSDSCQTWTQICQEESFINTITIDNKGAIIIGTKKSGLIFSKDMGEHWNKLGLDSIMVTTIAIYDSTTIVVGTYDGDILATTNFGKSWKNIDIGLPLKRSIEIISMDHNKNLYVGGLNLGLYKSTSKLTTLFHSKGIH